LQARRLSGGAFTDVGTLTTDAGGHFSRSVQPVAGTLYRAVFRGSSGASASVQRPAIAEATVYVQWSVALRARRGTARAGAKVKLAGVVTPTTQQSGAELTKVAVRVERKRGSGWVKSAVVTVEPKLDGTFSVTWRPRKAGSYRARATAAASPDLLAGASARIAIKVL
jgi:hypothetical protein